MKSKIFLQTIGIVIILLTIVHYFGLYNFPNPDALDKDYEVVISFCVGILLLSAPDFIINTAKNILGKATK